MEELTELAERLKNKNDQTEAFATMDTSFKDLSALLNFRDKEEEIRKHLEHKRAGTLPSDDQEMADYLREEDASTLDHLDRNWALTLKHELSCN